MEKTKISRKSKRKLATITVRTTENLAKRLKRIADIQGLSQTAIVITGLEREIIRREKEYMRQKKVQEDFNKAFDSDIDKNSKD
jgi:hypothetical protein